MKLELMELSPLLIDSVIKQGYAVVENCFGSELISSAKQEYAHCLFNHPLRPNTEGFVPLDIVASPWRKQCIGSRSGNGEPYSQVLQTTYFNANSSKYPALASIFSAMITLRNNLTGMRLDYGNDLILDSFWNACRIHHYPQGGGHMAAHRDTLFPHLLKGFKIPFIQLMVTLTDRGTDFEEGGGYIIDKSGNKVLFERSDNSGALVVFDGNIIHGVDDVDPSELLDFTSLKGRMAMFVNLYKNNSIENLSTTTF